MSVVISGPTDLIHMKPSEPNEFEKASLEPDNRGVVSEFWGLLKQNKKWWLLPIAILFLLLGLLIFLSGTGLAPFIYTLF